MILYLNSECMNSMIISHCLVIMTCLFCFFIARIRLRTREQLAMILK